MGGALSIHRPDDWRALTRSFALFGCAKTGGTQQSSRAAQHSAGLLYEYDIMFKVNNNSQQELLSCCFFDHVSSNTNKRLLRCYLCVPFHQLASPPGFHATHITKGNLVRRIYYMYVPYVPTWISAGNTNERCLLYQTLLRCHTSYFRSYTMYYYPVTIYNTIIDSSSGYSTYEVLRSIYSTY